MNQLADERIPIPGRIGWLLLILMTAAFLRLAQLSGAPPGLTHDEADHGLTAWEIVNGRRDIYFTIGYGREPLYDYVTAGLMALIGPTFLAGRLTAAYAGLLLTALLYAWGRRAFGERTALLSSAGVAVSFWPVMTSRQALRSSLLPVLFLLAVYFFWQGLKKLPKRFSSASFLTAGLWLGAAFYVYIPARALWGVLPAVVFYGAWRLRPFPRQVWAGLLLSLAIAGLTAWPLLHYLGANPGVEVRIAELSAPLKAAGAGDFQPLLTNIAASLRLFSIEGDPAWRYNLPGKPLLPPIWGLLFVLGAATAAWRAYRPGGHPKKATASVLALTWLAVGLAPVLVTGPQLATTQAVGMQPVLYLFPALALTKLGDYMKKWDAAGRGSWGERFFRFLRSPGFLILFFGVTAVFTYRDYFITWTNAPEVRVQYESTMVAAMNFLNESGAGATAVSSITPGPLHSQAVAGLVMHNDQVSLRWFDATGSLLLPAAGDSTLLLPGFTPLAPALTRYFETAVLSQILPLRASDLDRPLSIYKLNQRTMTADWGRQFTGVGPISFDNHVEFLGYDLNTSTASPGENVELASWWRTIQPLPNALIFSHVQGGQGAPIAQADRLDVPGESWQEGDQFIQLHTISIPADTAAGTYPVVIGLCQQSPAGCIRLHTADGRDVIALTTLTLTP